MVADVPAGIAELAATAESTAGPVGGPDGEPALAEELGLADGVTAGEDAECPPDPEGVGCG